MGKDTNFIGQPVYVQLLNPSALALRNVRHLVHIPVLP